MFFCIQATNNGLTNDATLVAKNKKKMNSKKREFIDPHKLLDVMWTKRDSNIAYLHEKSNSLVK